MVTIKEMYGFMYGFEKIAYWELLSISELDETCNDNYIILHTSFKADWLLGAYDGTIFLIT